jgi:hypothetical protein
MGRLTHGGWVAAESYDGFPVSTTTTTTMTT